MQGFSRIAIASVLVHITSHVCHAQDLQHQMLAAVEDAYEKRDPPFSSTELCERVFHSIKYVRHVSFEFCNLLY